MNQSMIAPSLIFTSCPDTEIARGFRTEFNRRKVRDLASFCGIAGRALPQEAASAIAVLRDVPITSRLSPMLFCWQEKLQSALRAQDVPAARDALKHLIRVASEPVADEVRVRLESVEDGPMRDILDANTGDYQAKLTRLGDPQRVANQSPALAEREGGLASTSTGTDGNFATNIRPLSSEHKRVVAGWLESSLQQMRAADPDLYGEICELVSEVRMYEGDGPRALTSVLAFGAIFIRWPADPTDGVLYMLENLAHEGSHLSLLAQMAVDPLVINAHDATFASPLRKDPRPLYGITHQVFVLARLHRLWDRLVQLGETWAGEKLVRDHQAFIDGYRVLIENAKLTKAGEQVIRSMPSCCRYADTGAARGQAVLS